LQGTASLDDNDQNNASAEDGRNRREHIRTRLTMVVKLTHPVMGEFLLNTGDISDGGAYVYEKDSPLPEIGEIVEIQVQGLPDGVAPVVQMRVRRKDKSGIGMSYLDAEDD
jgi:hypothetical protein